MQKVSEFRLYELSIAIHPLTMLQNRVKYSDVCLGWIDARSALESLFRERQLEFCYEAANKLYNAINQVVPATFEEAVDKMSPGEEEPFISFLSVRAILDAAKEFETVLRTELNNADTYFVEPKGTHKTSVLLADASREIPPSVLARVPDQVVEDFKQAGRCLLFECPTAVGFHLMRAVESVIYEYLRLLTGSDIPVKSRNWGVYIRTLRACNGDKRVIGGIEHMKDVYRNPILHPEVSLSSDDALVLFGLSVSVIVLLVHAMENVKGAALAFPAAQAITVEP